MTLDIKRTIWISILSIEHLIGREKEDLRDKIISVIKIDEHGKDILKNYSKMKLIIELNIFNMKERIIFYYSEDKREYSKYLW